MPAKKPVAVQDFKLVKPLTDLGLAAVDLKAGRYIEAVRKAAVAGAEITLHLATRRVVDAGRKPTFERCGLGFASEIAARAAEAPAICREIWASLLTRAIDPATANDLEIRKSDIERIQRLNPSDCVVLLGSRAFCDRERVAWKNSALYKSIRATDRRFRRLDKVYGLCESNLPLSVVVDVAGLLLGAKVTVNDDNLIHAIRVLATHGPDCLIENANICESLSAKVSDAISALFNERGDDRPMTDDAARNIREIRSLSIPPLVEYRLTAEGERLLSIVAPKKERDTA